MSGWQSTSQAQHFFELLDLNSEGLKETAEKVDSQDYEGGAEAYYRFLKKKFGGRDTGTPSQPKERALEQADALLEHKLSLLGSPLQDIGNPVDWVYYPNGDPQWQSHLGYMGYLESLIDAGRYTGEPKYARQWVRLVLDFIENHPWGTRRLSYSKRIPMYANEYVPVCGGEGFCPDYIGGSWISLACASRSRQWMKDLPFLVERDWISAVSACRVIQSIVTDHFYVMLNNPRKGTPNQYLHGASTLLELGVTFWEYKNAPAAYLVGMQRLEEAVDKCVLPDGTDLEQSPNYNTSLPNGFYEIYRIPGMKDNPRIQRLYEKIRQRCAYLAYITNPLGAFPDIAKTHGDPVAPLLHQYTDFYADLSEVRSVAEALDTGKDDGRLPRSVDFPYGGYSVMRDSWEREARYLMLKYSRWSPGHKHEDANSLVLTAFGRNMLVDTGNYNYSDDEQSQPIHAYLYAAKGHNTMDVDGLSQNRMRMEADLKVDERWPDSTTNEREYQALLDCRKLHEHPCPGVRYHSEQFDFVQGFYSDGYGDLPASFERDVIYVRGIAFLVVDQMEVSDSREHVFTQHWHFGKDYRKEDIRLSDGQVQTMDPAGPNLFCRCFGNAPLTAKLYYGEKHPYRGWYVIDYNDMEPAAEVEYRWKGSGKQKLVTLLYPYRGADAGVEIQEDASGFTACFPEGERISFFWEEKGFRIQADGAGMKENCLRFDGTGAFSV